MNPLSTYKIRFGLKHFKFAKFDWHKKKNDCRQVKKEWGWVKKRIPAFLLIKGDKKTLSNFFKIFLFFRTGFFHPNSLQYPKSKFMIFVFLFSIPNTGFSSDKITMKESLQCVSGIRKLKKEVESKDVIEPSYLDNYVGWFMMNSPISEMKPTEIKKAVQSADAKLEYCKKIDPQAAQNLWLIDKWQQHKDFDQIPKRIFRCAIALKIMDQVAEETGNKSIHSETEAVGKNIGAIMGSFVKKYDLKDKMAKLGSKKERFPEKEPGSILTQKSFQELKKNCEVFD